MIKIIQTPHLFKELPSYERQGWGILDRLDTLWSDEVYTTPEEARAYVENNVIPEHVEYYTFVRVTSVTTVVEERSKFGVMIAKAVQEAPENV